MSVDLGQWSVKRWVGASPPREWLVGGVIPLGSVGLLATQGDADATTILLDLALKVAGPASAGPQAAFGHEIMAGGGAVVVCGHDDTAEIHRRLEGIDPGAVARPLCKDFYAVPGLSLDAVADWVAALDGQVQRIPALKLIALDGIAVSAQGMEGLVRLAQKLACAVVVTATLPDAPIATFNEAGGAVQATSALAPGMRWAYAIWPMMRDQALKAQRRYAIDGTAKAPEPTPSTWYGGALVRPYTEGMRGIGVWQRDHGAGILRFCDERDPTTLIKQAKDGLIAAIDKAWREDRPFQRGSKKDGLYARRAELPAVVRGLGMLGMVELADELLARGELRLSRQPGTGARYLRLPNAPVSPQGRPMVDWPA